VCAAALAAPVFGSAAPSVEARINAAEIFEGESVAYDVAVKNVKNETPPDLSEFNAAFDVASKGQFRESGTFTVIVNGRDISPGGGSDAIIYQYELTPKHTGNLTIPAPFITIDGKKIAGRSLPLRVVTAEKQDLVIVKVDAGRQRVVPYQPFELTFKVMVKPLPLDDRDPVALLEQPRIQINWIELPPGISSQKSLQEWLNPLVVSPFGRGFHMQVERQFYAFNLYKGREVRKGLDGKDYNYFVYELKRTLFATRAGTFQFGPATVKGSFVDGVDQRARRYTTRALVATASAITIASVLPEPRPANFNGCYGSYTLRASVNATDLRVGDPLTLKLDFERSSSAGMLEEVTAPDLTVIKDLTDDFTVVDKSPPGQTKGNVKSYSYVMRPKKPGVSIPPIKVAVFNTDSEKFEESAFNAVALNVTDAPQLRPDELISGAPLNSSRKISGRDKGVFQNISESSEIGIAALNPNAYWTILAALWVAYGIGALALTVHRRRAGDALLQNRIRARAEAAGQMESARGALKNGDASGAALAVQRAITGLIGYWNGAPPAGMTAADAESFLARSGASSESRTETARILESIEATKYGSVAGMQADSLVQAADKLIPKLQREMESRD
jgi:hypothetical protein